MCLWTPVSLTRRPETTCQVLRSCSHFNFPTFAIIAYAMGKIKVKVKVCVRSRDVDTEGTGPALSQHLSSLVGSPHRWRIQAGPVGQPCNLRYLGIDCDVVDIIREYQLRWLGHVGRMNNDRIPKRVLFGELPATRPHHGPRKRWCDVIVDDLRSISPPPPPTYLLTADLTAHVERSAVVLGTSSATLRTAKLADSPFAVIAIGNGHVQGSRCVCVHTCVPGCVRLVGCVYLNSQTERTEHVQ